MKVQHHSIKSKAPDLNLKEVHSTRKGTTGIRVTDYVKERDYVINEIINAAHVVYPKDREIMNVVINLTVELQVAKPDSCFVQDLHGFLNWASMTNQPYPSVLTTCIHDLGEFARNRTEKWFCPRTTGYRKYLTGASNL